MYLSNNIQCALQFSVPYNFISRNIAIAIWLITQGMGTLFNAGIAFLPISLLTSFFFYVGLMLIVTVVFVLLNRKYKYKEDMIDVTSNS